MKRFLNIILSLCLLLQMNSLVFHATATSASQKPAVFVDDDITVDTIWSGDYNYYICSTGNDEPKIPKWATPTTQ